MDDGLGLGFLRYRMYNNKYDIIFLKSFIPFTEDEKSANNFILRNNRKDSEGTQYILDIYETNPLGYEDSCDIFTPVKVLTYDYEKRKYNKKQYDEYDLNELGFPKIQNMESFTNFNMFKNGKQWIYNNSKTVYENRYPLYNTLSRGLLLTNTLVVTTYGNIIRCAGQTMNISTDAIINDLNQRYDGDFLITSVVHVFKASDYFTHIQCARMKQKPAEYGFIHNTINKVKKFINKNLGI